MKTMTASVASKEFGRYLDAAQREPVIVTKQSRPVAVTLSFQDWEELNQFRIEQGLSRGIEDVKNGHFSEMNDANTASRLEGFKERSKQGV